MKDLKAESIRNIVLLSYNGAGKTALVEAILAAAGSIAQMGSIAAGTAAMDYEPEEHHRKLSVHSSLCQLSWNDTGLNLIDTPGAPSFYADARQATNWRRERNMKQVGLVGRASEDSSRSSPTH